jgi:hypothetical protein
MVLGHPSRMSLSTPPITSSRISTQPTIRHSWRGRTGLERHDVGRRRRELLPNAARHQPRGTAIESCTSTSPLHVPVPRCSSQCTFLQMTYTAGNLHAAGDGQLPEDAHAAARPTEATPRVTHPANYNRMIGGQMSCRLAFLRPMSTHAGLFCDASEDNYNASVVHVSETHHKNMRFISCQHCHVHRIGHSKRQCAGGHSRMMSKKLCIRLFTVCS